MKNVTFFVPILIFLVIFLFWFFWASIEGFISVMNYLNNIKAIWGPKKVLELQVSGDSRRYKECEDCWTIANIFSTFRFWFLRALTQHPLSIMNLFKQFFSHMSSQKILKLQGSGDSGGYKEYENSSLFIPLLTF